MRELDPITFLVAESLFRNDRSESGKSARHCAPRRAINNTSLAAKGACLVLLAHGSKDPRWRAPFERIAQELQKKLGKQRVRLAYMEFVGPTLMDVAHECVQQLTLNIRLLPSSWPSGPPFHGYSRRGRACPTPVSTDCGRGLAANRRGRARDPTG